MVMVGQIAKKGLNFASFELVPVSGQLAKVSQSNVLIEDQCLGRLFYIGN